MLTGPAHEQEGLKTELRRRIDNALESSVHFGAGQQVGLGQDFQFDLIGRALGH
jgi:hypothetical protein